MRPTFSNIEKHPLACDSVRSVLSVLLEWANRSRSAIQIVELRSLESVSRGDRLPSFDTSDGGLRVLADDYPSKNGSQQRRDGVDEAAAVDTSRGGRCFPERLSAMTGIPAFGVNRGFSAATRFRPGNGLVIDPAWRLRPGPHPEELRAPPPLTGLHKPQGTNTDRASDELRFRSTATAARRR
jgi:hypothetical protein